MASAEDGNAHLSRPQAGSTEPDDVVDDATDVCLLYFTVPQWSGSLLGGIKCHHYCNSVLYDRLGSADFINSQAAASGQG